jgi:hypothetical protein
MMDLLRFASQCAYTATTRSLGTSLACHSPSFCPSCEWHHASHLNVHPKVVPSLFASSEHSRWPAIHELLEPGDVMMNSSGHCVRGANLYALIYHQAIKACCQR